MEEKKSFYLQHVPQSEYRHTQEKTGRAEMDVNLEGGIQLSKEAVKEQLKDIIQANMTLIISKLLPESHQENPEFDDLLTDIYSKLGLQ